MAKQPVIFHNPRCSKSRASLQLLEQRDYQPDIIEYQSTPPTAEELKRILGLLQMSPRQLMRTGQSEYRDNNLDNPDLTDDQLVKAMIDYPILIERPIVLFNGKAAIGRPPENILDLL